MEGVHNRRGGRLPSFHILKVCGGEWLVSRFDRFIYVKRAALKSDRRLGGVSRPGLSCGLVYTLSLLINSSSSPVTGSFIGRCILTAVFVRSRATWRTESLEIWSFHSGVLGCYAVCRVDWQIVTFRRTVRVKQFKKSDPEDAGTQILRNVGNYWSRHSISENLNLQYDVFRISLGRIDVCFFPLLLCYVMSGAVGLILRRRSVDDLNKDSWIGDGRGKGWGISPPVAFSWCPELKSGVGAILTSSSFSTLTLFLRYWQGNCNHDRSFHPARKCLACLLVYNTGCTSPAVGMLRWNYALMTRHALWSRTMKLPWDSVFLCDNSTLKIQNN